MNGFLLISVMCLGGRRDFRAKKKHTSSFYANFLCWIWFWGQSSIRVAHINTGGFDSSSFKIRLSRVNSVSLFRGFVLFSTVFNIVLLGTNFSPV